MGRIFIGVVARDAGKTCQVVASVMGRFDNLREIESLDPERDCQRIMHLSFGYEFSWDSTRALELALYRTYCVPSISGLLDRTGEFYRHTQRRYDDTAILIAEMCEWGYERRRAPAQTHAKLFHRPPHPDTPGGLRD